MPPTPDQPCLCCKVKVGKHDKSIQCSFCKHWVHIECGDVTETLYKEMCARDKTHGHFWVCTSCKSTSFIFHEEIDKLKERMGSCEARQMESETTVSKLTGAVETTNKRIDNLEKNKDSSG